MDDFLHHMLRLGNFAWELRNHWLEQLLCEPLSAAAWVHRWLTAAEGSRPPPPPRPGKHFVASFRVVNGTLECPPQEDPSRTGTCRGVSRGTYKTPSSRGRSLGAAP